MLPVFWQVFPNGQGAGDAGETFERDDGNRREVSVAEPGIAHPAPAEAGAQPHQRQTAHDEPGDQEMRNEQCVGGYAGPFARGRRASEIHSLHEPV